MAHAKPAPQEPTTTRRKATGRPFTKGADPRRHPGGNKGSGRKPEAFKQLCRDLASRDATVAVVETILSDPAHPAFLGALKWATEHGYGKPTQEVTVDATVRPGVVILPALGGGE